MSSSHHVEDPVQTWSDALRSGRFRLLMAATLAGLVAALLGLNQFLQWNEHRAGTKLIDPCLSRLPAFDLSVPIFALLYGTLIVAIAHLAPQPRRLLIALQAYALMALVRMAMMYNIPLEAPPGMILLIDPFVSAFGDGDNWSKDLFFSGHTATTFLCAISVRSSALRLLCLSASACVAALVLLQHAHYTIDVLVAPFVSFTVMRLAQHLTARALQP